MLGYYTAEELGFDLEGMRGYININGETVTVTLEDDLAFHRERLPELFNEHGTLKMYPYLRLSEIAHARYHAHTTIEGDDAPCAVFEIAWSYVGEPTTEKLTELIWPTIAKLLNETDPGTFGTPYLYDLVAGAAQ